MRFRCRGPFVAAILCSCALVRPCQANFTLSLGSASRSGNIVSFAVNLDYVSDEPNDSPLDQLGYVHAQPSVVTFMRLDLSGSTASLAPGGDFSAFSFTPSSALTGWDSTSFDPSLIRYILFDDSMGGSGIGISSRTLGTLSYDLNVFGITPSTSLLVSIGGNGAPSDIGSLGIQDPRGVIAVSQFDLIPPTPANAAILDNFRTQTGFDAAWVDTFGFVNPKYGPGIQPLQGPSGTAVPEPASISLAASAGLWLSFYAWRRRRSS